MRLSGLVATLALLVVGCGGTKADSHAVKPVPRDQFASQFENAICDNLGACCTNAGYGYDAAACKVALDAQLGSIFNVKGTYDANRAGLCLQSVSQAMKACQGLDAAETTPCVGVFTGTAQPGQPCTADPDCASVNGAYAMCKDVSTTEKACTVFPRRQNGAACNVTCFDYPGYTFCQQNMPGAGNDACYLVDGLYCASNGKCASPPAAGQACGAAQTCAAGAYCNVAMGKCVAAVGPGSACLFPNSCKDGSYCASGTCQALKGDGASCTNYPECASGLCTTAGKCGTPTASKALCGG